MPTTRAKFICSEKVQYIAGEKIKLSAVITGSKENENFFKWTPNGTIEIGILNPDVQFEVGKEYYVDFTKAE